MVYAPLEGQVGGLYVFDTQAGGLLHTISNPTPNSYENFGRSVVLHKNALLVEVCGDEDYPGGAAYLYDVETGAEIAVFTYPEAADELVCFGSGISLSDDYVAVAALSKVFAGLNKPRKPNGSEVILFDRQSGDIAARHVFANETDAYYYKVATAIRDKRLVVGIAGDDRRWKDAGSVYIFPLPQPELDPDRASE